MAKIPPGVGPRFPQVVVLVGATGDLARRKLLPGLFHLSSAGFIPGCRIIGVSLDDLDLEGFRKAARGALDEFSARKVTDADWDAFAKSLDYVSLAAGASALKAAVERAEQSLGGEARRLHYLSVPPSAALPAVRMLAEAGLVERSRIVMEKPFGTDLASAVSLNAKLHEVFDEAQIFRIDHFLGKEPAQNILAFRFANGLFEPIWNRNFIDHVQIDVPETLGTRQTLRFLRADRRLPRHGGHPSVPDPRVHGHGGRRPALEPSSPSARRRTRCSAACCPSTPADVVRGQYTGYRSEEGVVSRFGHRNLHRAEVLHRQLALGRGAVLPAHRQAARRKASASFRSPSANPPRACSPSDSGIGAQGPDHLTFDLADASKVSLSFYGKRPGPGMRLDKLSLQFAMHDTGLIGDVLEAYERLILDAMRGDRTLFTTAEGIERLWQVSTQLLEAPPPVRLYPPGSWGPKSIHQLIAPHAWRLPFERAWRDPNRHGG